MYTEYKSIVPIYQGGTLIEYKNQLFTTNINRIFITNLKTSKTRFIEFPSKITTFNIYNDILSVSIESTLYIFDVHSTSLKDSLKFHFKNFFIKCIKQTKEFILLCNEKRSIQILNLKNNLKDRIDINNTITAMEVYNAEIKDGDGNKDLLMVGDEKGNIFVYNLENKNLEIKLCKHKNRITGLFYEDGFYSTSETELYNWKNKQTKELEIKKIIKKQQSYYFINAKGLFKYDSKNVELIRKGEYYNIILGEEEVWVTSQEFEIIGFKSVFIGYNDEITDLVIINDRLFIATNSGRLRFINLKEYSNDNYIYACKAILLEGHSDVIMKLSYYNNLLMSVSKDNKILLWDIENLIIIKSIQSHTNGINCGVISDGLFVSGGSDNILQIWNISEKIENIFTKIVHLKEINSLEIDEKRKLIFSASLDKSIKIFDYKGNEKKVCIGHKKGVWSIALGNEVWLSGSSDKTIRVWNYNYDCIGVLQCESGVLKCLIYENDKLAITSCGDGSLIVWDLKKKVKLNTLMVNGNIWGMCKTLENNLWIGESGVIRFYFESSEIFKNEKIEKEKRKKEIEFLINKHQSDPFYLVKLYFENELNGLLKIIEKIGFKEELMEIFKEDIFKFKKWLKNISLKMRNCEIVNLLINNGIKKGWFKKNEFIILEKHVKAINGLFLELLGNELLF